MKFFILLFCLSASLCAENISADPSCRSFEMRQPSKHRIDTFDFDGDFPDLENIDIDARRKKNVKFHLTGNYPQLEQINYEGGFGVLSGDLTGSFPKLSLINVLCTNCAMQLDLNAQWQQTCQINIRGAKEDIVLQLPKDVGLIIHTKTAPKGKVVLCDGIKKKGRSGILNKRWENEIAATAPILLIINIELTEGRIIFN